MHKNVLLNTKFGNLVNKYTQLFTLEELNPNS